MPGAVVSVCGYLHLYLHPDHLTDLCLQEYKLILEWGNNKYIIDESRSGTVDVRGPLGVTLFNRNHVDADTLIADFDDTTLMLFVQVLQPECLGSVIHCAFGREAPFAYRINFPEISITHLDRNRLDFSGFRISDLIWNNAGTKAFSVSTKCPAGCPNQVLEIYDVVTDTYSTILNRDTYLQLMEQYGHMVEKETPISSYFKWNDNETISFFNERFFVGKWGWVQ